MVESDWGDWLPTAVAAADAAFDVWYLGCNGFVIKADETVVFVDPYLGTGDPPRTVRMVPIPFDPADVERADAVLATHEHSDHVHGPSQAPLLEDGGTFYGPDDSVAVTAEEAWPDEWAVDESQFTTVEEGDELGIGSLTVHVEPARDPDASHPVSYVFEHAEGTFFHGGDARASESFVDIGERYDIDVAALAFGSAGMILDKETREPTHTQWYADENLVVQAAAQLQADRLLPTHWDMWKGLTADPAALWPHVRSFEYPRTLELVEIGDRVEI